MMITKERKNIQKERKFKIKCYLSALMAYEDIYNYTLDELRDSYYSVDVSGDVASRYIEMYKSMPILEYDKIRTKDKETLSVSADIEIRDSEA